MDNKLAVIIININKFILKKISLKTEIILRKTYFNEKKQ